MDERTVATIARSRVLSVEVTDKPVEGAGNVFLVSWLAKGETTIPMWWSPSRDIRLRWFWKESNHLSGAIYTMQSKLTAIPVRVEARNMGSKQSVADAYWYTDLINRLAGYGRGWASEYGKFVEDLLCTDNGGFLQVIGEGDVTGPIKGMAISFSHLDSCRCQRTGNAIYPVIYTDEHGKRWKLHFTRIMESSQMPSTAAEMNGVGFCSISRCAQVAQTLIDILTYKQEKLGSRPHRELIITRGGLDPKDIAAAFGLAEQKQDQVGLTRYSKIVVGGSAALPEADIREVKLSELPDGFDEESSTTLGMAFIAMALGTDPRELFPALTSGATRADALLQHLKQRGKGPGQILQATEVMFNFKFLPAHLRFASDFQDDAQDRQSAEIKMVRVNKRVQDLASGVMDDRVQHEQMLNDGDIDQAQFDRLELSDGRLPEGIPVIALFFSKEKNVRQYLDMGVENPLDVNKNNPELMLAKITDKRQSVYTALANTNNPDERWLAYKADSALNQLEVLYLPTQVQVEEGMPKTSVPGKNGNGTKPAPPNKGDLRSVAGSDYIDPRNRRVDLTQPSHAETSYGEAMDAASGGES